MKKIAKNLVWGLSSQLLILAMGIILPRFILLSFGSEINGVTSTISQIFVYLALLEAGIGNASVNCLYKALSKNDREGISTVLSATRKYFRKIVPIYAACVVVFAAVYPLLLKSEVPPQTVRLIILIQGLSGVMNFYFTSTLTQLLVADGRTYVTSNLTLLVKVVSTTLQIVLISSGFDIVSVQIAHLCAYILQALILAVYVKRHYPWLKKVKDADVGMLKERNSFVVHEISTVIFQSTDVILISVFCSLKEASVYSVYNLVFVALSKIFSIFFTGVDFTLGIEYHRDKEKYITMHDTYEKIYSCVVFAMISAAFVVILPFIKLYTAGITDINYVQPILPILFSLIQLLSCSRAVASKLITISGNARNTVPNSIAEMVINLVSSLILVNLFGLPGVLMGTILALLYRANDIIIFANRKILHRSPLHAYKTPLINLLLFALVVVFVKLLPLHIHNYLSFFVYGFISLIVSFIVYFGVHGILDKNVRLVFLQFIKKITIKRKKEGS